MNTRWVCKTATEDKDRDTTLEEMWRELAIIIGSDNIIAMEIRGETNAYEITTDGWEILTQGFSGPQGFKACKSV